MSARAEYQAAYYRRNREAIRARQRETRDAQSARERSAAWRAANPERAAAGTAAWHAAHPESRARSTRRWREANRQAVALAAHARRARIRGTRVADFTFDRVSSRRAFLGEKCWMCGGASQLQWDHVKPLAKGGAHMLANLRLACSRCNNVKSDRWLGVGRLRELKSIVLARSQGGVGR